MADPTIKREVSDAEIRRDAYRLPRRTTGSVVTSLRTANRGEYHVCRGRVLVMEDQEIVRSMLCVMLLALGYDTRPASNDAEVIADYAKAKESGKPFDAVIIDLDIPGGMGGKEAVSRLVEIDPGVKAVLSSGDREDPTMEEFALHGFAGALRKPYSIGELRRVMNDALCGRRFGLCGVPSDGPGSGC